MSGFGYASHGRFEVCENCSLRDQRDDIGTSTTGDISTMGCVLSLLSSFKVAWILIVPSSLNYGEDATKSMAKLLDTTHRLMPYM
jgi:hypothetical protein